MKKIVLAMLLVAAVTAVAQTAAAPAQPAPQQTAAPAPAAPQKKEIKDPAEYNAYVGAVQQTLVRRCGASPSRASALQTEKLPVLIDQAPRDVAHMQ